MTEVPTSTESTNLNSVVISRDDKNAGWKAVHVPSGREVFGATAADAEAAMREAIGMNETGDFVEPLTSDLFSGIDREIALFLEGPISEMLALHSGFARLERFEAGTAHIRLGGGCQGCPSSTLTLISGVKQQLQEKFGEDVIIEVAPVW